MSKNCSPDTIHILKEEFINWKEIFCRHEYELVAKRKSMYCIDYHSFSDFGLYEDYLYKCKKCGHQHIEVRKGPEHPCYAPWQYVQKDA